MSKSTDALIACPNCAEKVDLKLTGCPHCKYVMGRYDKTIRGQIFEVIVRQAQAGVPWQQICGEVMSANGIKPAEVELEMHRRKKYEQQEQHDHVHK